MRKNFLILMLMALLPLASWAEDLTGNEGIVVAVADKGYGADDFVIPDEIRVTLDGGEISHSYWEIEGYYETKDGAKKNHIADLTVGKERFVKITFKNVYSGYAWGKFEVTKGHIVVTVKTADYFKRAFMAPNPGALVIGDVSAKLNGTAVTASTYLNIAEVPTYTTNATATSPVGDYTLSFTGIALKDATNYDLDYSQKKFVIEPAEITAGAAVVYYTKAELQEVCDDVTAMGDDDPIGATNAAAINAVMNGTYTEATLKSAVADFADFNTTVSAIVGPGSEYVKTPAVPTLFAFNDDYTAGDFKYTAVEQKPTVTIAWDHDNNAGTAAINLTEGTDFTIYYQKGGVTVANPTDAGDYVAYVAGKGNYKTAGDGIAVAAINFAIDQAKLTVMTIAQKKVYDGAAFNPATAQFSISGRQGADASKTVTGLEAVIASNAAGVNKYNVTVNAASAKIDGKDLNINYDVDGTEIVKWEIEQRPVNITIGNAEMAVGADAFPAVPAVTVELKGETNPNSGAIDATEQTDIATAIGVAVLQNAVGQTYETELAAANTAAVGPYVDAYEVNVAALPANYKLGTYTKGKLTVKGAAFDIMPVVAATIEYGDAIEISAHATGGATYDPETVSFTVKNSKGVAVDITKLPLPLGIYTVEINEGVVGTGANEGATVTRVPGAFNITKKHITLTVANKTVKKNDPAQAFLDGLAAAADSYTKEEDLVGNDALVLEFSLKGINVDAKTGKITSEPAAYAGAIEVKLTDAAVNANYDITGYTAGTLTIDATFAAILQNDGNAPTIIAEAAANGSEYEVTIKGRALKAGQWNAMVLPFEIEPLEFCNALGQYAVFNTLDKVEKDANNEVLKDKIYFKLEMNKIPANIPFLVKPLEAVAVTDEINIGGVVFKGTGSEPVYTGVDGAKFTGTYKATADIESTNWWALASGVFKHFSKERTDGLKFTNAFIELTSGASAAEFFVEDIDNNGVTAIKSINADEINGLNVKGMYNLNGMKMNNVPTQKGVYIVNGKKVVIK